MKMLKKKTILRHKILAGILFFILYAPFIYSSILQAEKQWHQHQQDISSASHTLVHIEIPSSHLQWERNHKEIIIDGRYFDVKDCQIRNNIAYIIGHFDEKESFYTYTIHQLQSKANNTGDNSFALQQLQWFSVFTAILSKQTFSINEICFLNNKFFNQPTPNIKHPYRDVAVLPPWS